jgi:c-di-GMP-binding flagellar brake protein YcgR
MSTVEQRSSVRVKAIGQCTLRHVSSGRDFPSRCLDISDGGMKLAVPLTAPLLCGHRVEISLPASISAGRNLAGGEWTSAEIVRVDRGKLVTDAALAVGIRFTKPDDDPSTS